MRPISLEIKGLNSFIEPQKIDFEKLTERGLFGIFGPTGSGKSTILDGITLALYGEVARKSTNFMNTNCESLHVSYEFQITEKEVKRYLVEREFKRDKKTEAVRTKSAKIISIEGEKEEVLEEQVRPVTEKCEEIIGLKLEDFTRTVVLPQGSFSEFLKLEGKEKRNMLERLFNLQKYGDDLSFKLGRKIKKEKEKCHILEGELKVYEDCNEEILREKKERLADTEKLQEESKKELEVARENYNEGKEVWDLQIDLKSEMEKEKELRTREDEINEYEKKATLGESALKIEPHIKRYEETFGEIEKVKEELVDLKEKLKELNEKRDNQKIIYEAAKNRKENELSDLKIKRQQMIEAIDEEKILIVLLEETIFLNKRIAFIEKELEEIIHKINENDQALEKQNFEISKREEIVEKLKIPEEYKKKINEAVVLLKSFDNLEEQKNQLNQEITILISELENEKSQRISKLEELDRSKESMKEKKGMLELLENNCPGNQDILMDMQNKLFKKKDYWDKYKKYLDEVNAAGIMIQKFKEELVRNEKERVLLIEEEITLGAQIRNQETENIAHTLRMSLSKGEACPVCGSTEHFLENMDVVESGDLEERKSAHKKVELKCQESLSEMTKIMTNLETQENRKKEYEHQLLELGEEFKKVSAEDAQKEFDMKKLAIEDHNTKKSALEKEIKELIDSCNKLEISYTTLNTLISEKEEHLKKYKNNLFTITTRYRETKVKIEEQKAELSVEDFIQKRDEIFQMETRKSKLETEVKELRLTVAYLQKEGVTLIKAANKLREELQEKKTSHFEKSKQIEEKKNTIALKVGKTKDLEKSRDEISTLIKKIEEEYLLAERIRTDIEEKYQDYNNKIISAMNNQFSLTKRNEIDKERLEIALKEERFESINRVKESLITRSQIESLKKEIEEYKDSMIRVYAGIDTLKRKLNNRSLTEEEWTAIQKKKEESTVKLKALEDEKVKAEETVKLLSRRLIKKQELLQQKSKFDYNLGIFDDLEKLFKGKKFVEFVAANQLKYVSMEAGKKLKEITGGGYGLEVDENGKFLIRDYKNGGARRDATTLSGGETFLASLSLALALSAQIQLKGTAPLEFFFLDEGFGTLDDNLLEVVMDSLEKIHHDKLSIGIISHLEAIKSRIPVKLIVTPAEAGMGGSKVRIERS